jgi:archaellum biogenesis protein FlaJ (TadC family)
MIIRVLIAVFLANLSLLNASQDKVFKIGSLLPEINSLSFSKIQSQNLSSKTGVSISNAIHFASQKLSELFFKEYGCNLKLDLASTKVCNMQF